MTTANTGGRVIGEIAFASRFLLDAALAPFEFDAALDPERD